MKKKGLLIITIAVLEIIAISIVMKAFQNQPNVENSIETMESSKEDKKYKEISNENIQEVAKQYVKKNKLVEELSEDFNIQKITDSGSTYYSIGGNGISLEIYQESGDLKSYIKIEPQDYISGTTYEAEDVEEKGKQLFEENELVRNKQNYKFEKIEIMQNSFPKIWFKDTTDNKLLFIKFNPENKEIIQMGTM